MFINIDGAIRSYSGIAACVSIFRGSMGSLLEFSLYFLMFILLWLLNFMELYMFWRKLKSWVLLMSGWNVTLHWFVLRLLPRQMFLGCFVIDEILVLIIVEKSSFTHIFREGNTCVDKLANL